MKLILPLLSLLIITWNISSLAAQESTDEPWPVRQNCVAPANAPITSYPGVIFAYEPETGIRAVRADMVTSYIVAFEGSNFTGAGAVSPDGQWLAVPAGNISFMTMVDETYQISEIRIQSTAPGTATIAYRIPWSASYRGTERDWLIPDVEWLDNQTLLYAKDDWEFEPETADVIEFNPFDGQENPVTNPIHAYLNFGVSPDGTRAFGLLGHKIGLYDVETTKLLVDFTLQRPEVATWSADSSLLAVAASQRIDNENVPQLMLFDRDGRLQDVVTDLPAAQIQWSPDGSQLAFSVYDEARRAAILHVADLQNESITDTCVPVRYGDHTTGYGIRWSPDGALLAIMTESALPLQILDLAAHQLRYIDTYTEGGPSFIIAWRPLTN